jgi:hypothetical protein
MKWRKNRVCDLPLGRPREDRSSPSARPLALPRSHNLPPPRVRLPYPKSLIPIPRARPLALPPVPQSPTTACPPPPPKITPSNPTHVESASLPTLPPLVPPPPISPRCRRTPPPLLSPRRRRSSLLLSSRLGMATGNSPLGIGLPSPPPPELAGDIFSHPRPRVGINPRGDPPLPSALIYSIQDC